MDMKYAGNTKNMISHLIHHNYDFVERMVNAATPVSAYIGYGTI